MSGTYSGTYTGDAGAPGLNGGTGRDLTGVNTITSSGIVTGGVGGYTAIGTGTSGGTGVKLAAGGTLANAGTVTGGAGGQGGVIGGGGSGGGGGNGVDLQSGSTLNNTGIISGGAGGNANGFGNSGGLGGTGVNFIGGGTLTNAGVIGGGAGGIGTTDGNAGAAVRFGSGDSCLIVQGGAVFNGRVIATESANNVLELSATGGPGTIGSIGVGGTQFTGFDHVHVNSGAQWHLTGANTIGVNRTLTNAGTLTNDGSLTVSGTLTNNASAEVHGGGGLLGISVANAGTVINHGTVRGSDGAGGSGVSLQNGGWLNNDGTVRGGDGFYLDGLLILAEELVNGRNIVREQVSEVRYIYIELEAHDVIWAEGAAAETFVDDNSRMMFENAREYAGLYPDDVRQPALYYAERVTEGYRLQAVRERIEQRTAGDLRRAA